MKRCLALLTCALIAGCGTKVASVAPAPGAEDTPNSSEPDDALVADLSMPSPPPFATQTGNPPSATCDPFPPALIPSTVGCTELITQLQEMYGAPRQIQYLDGNWTDAYPFRVAEDPFSLSYCAMPEQKLGWMRPAPSEPFCLCASAMNDWTPVAVGRFGGMTDAGRPEMECGHQRRMDSELERTCLYEGREFPGCNPDVVDSCTDTCAVFRERAVEYYATTYEIEVRRSRFSLSPCQEGGTCQLVFQLGGQCFAMQRPRRSNCPDWRLLPASAQDCSLSDDELLIAAGLTPVPEPEDAAVPNCTPPTPDGGTAADASTTNPPADSGTSPAPDDAG